ncbi:MAG: HNH endonuclease [Pusillimonas sp.]|nr:HNH endonuclease [Pusillimonas sp.]
MPTKPGTHKAIKRITQRHEVERPNYGQGRGGRPWRRKRERILKRDGYMCQCPECKGIKRIAHEVDHVLPISQGGTDDDSNLQAINRDCHKAKTQAEALRGRK